MPSLAHIHPVLVHFPIVFFLTLAAIDVIATARGSAVTGRTALGSLTTGLAVAAGVFAVAAFVFGGIALGIAEDGGFHSDVAEIHEGLGTVTAFALLGWALVRVFLWWRDLSLPSYARSAVAALEFAGAALIIATAYYGGELVYGLGVNVARVAQGG